MVKIRPSKSRSPKVLKEGKKRIRNPNLQKLSPVPERSLRKKISFTDAQEPEEPPKIQTSSQHKEEHSKARGMKENENFGTIECPEMNFNGEEEHSDAVTVVENSKTKTVNQNESNSGDRSVGHPPKDQDMSLAVVILNNLTPPSGNHK